MTRGRQPRRFAPRTPDPSAGLEVDAVTVTFDGPSGPVSPVQGVSWSVRPGRALVILGESGSGKSMTALAVAGILPGGGRVSSGEIRWAGSDLLTDPRAHAAVRGTEIAMIFQDPLASLNPGYTVGAQIGEMFRAHSDLTRAQARRRVVELLDEVRIPDPQDRVDRYPHELSGGMRQRVMIAMAISQSPSVLIADEPTTALDATIQLQVIETLRRLQADHGTSVVLITHDIGVAASVADDVVVMYAGRVVERGPAMAVLREPRHPYTRALLASAPSVDGTEALSPVVWTPSGPSDLEPVLHDEAPAATGPDREDAR